MSVSPLSTAYYPSPNCGNYVSGALVKNRTHAIDTITIHHMAGNFSLGSVGASFGRVERQASSNYGIDSDGNIAAFVDESIRAWTSGNAENDNRAVTFEVANDGQGPDWHVSDRALESLVRLVADVCSRNGIKELKYTGDKTGNMTLHKWFQATACPGPYLESKMGEIADRVNRLLRSGTDSGQTDGTPKNGEKVVYRVQTGAYKVRANAEKMAEKLRNDGFSTYIAEKDGIIRVQVGAFTVKANAEKIAEALKAKGYACFITSPDKFTVSEPVETKKTVEELAKEVIGGLWGVGQERKKRITDAGYDYAAVQKRVNELMK